MPARSPAPQQGPAVQLLHAPPRSGDDLMLDPGWTAGAVDGGRHRTSPSATLLRGPNPAPERRRTSARGAGEEVRWCGVPDPVEEMGVLLDGLARTSTCSVVRLRRGGRLGRGLAGPYGGHDLGELLERVALLLAERYRERPEELKLLDLERGIRPTGSRTRRWSATSATRTASPAPWRGREHLDYLGELGIRYLHLMPLLAPREGDSDGGHGRRLPRRRPPAGDHGRPGAAVRAGQAAGMSVCVDLVLNHCAAEHDWAVAARAGDPEAEAIPRSSPTGSRSTPTSGPRRGLPRLRAWQLQLRPRDRASGPANSSSGT